MTVIFLSIAEDAVDDAVIVDAVIDDAVAGRTLPVMCSIITYHACYNSIYFGSTNLTFDI